VIYKASNSGLDMGIMNSLRGFGGDEFHYHTFVPAVDDAADAANGNGPEADALGTAVTLGTVEEEAPASALEAVDWDAGNGNQEETWRLVMVRDGFLKWGTQNPKIC